MTNALPGGRQGENAATGVNAHATAAIMAGLPVFAERAMADIAAREGVQAAWSAAFRATGPHALANVHGDFSVGLALDDGAIILAVDRFAVRSMCYSVVDGKLKFAERALDLGATEADIDPQAIFDYLYFHVIPSPRTIYRNVYRLPPGHYALFRNGVLSVAPYWKPEFEEPKDADFGQLRKEFRNLLHASVKAQIPEGVPTGCFLSGGTDSSTVAGFVREVTGEPASTFSIGFDASGYDEMEFSRIAAKHFGAKHHEYYITPSDLVTSIPEVAGSYDQPFGNSSVLPAYYCARLAREHGITRMLGGDGGDELFGGNTRYAKQLVFGVYSHIPALIRKPLLEPLAADGSAIARLPGVKKAASYVRQARVPMPDRMHTYNLLMRLGPAEVLTAAFLASIDPKVPERHQREIYAECTAPSLMNRMLAYDWRYTLAETDLPKVVGATKLAGVDTGFPMLDDRLVAFSSRLPPDYKVNRLKLRWFFKEALRGFLPDEIITKKKQGFGLPFGVWANQDSALLGLARDSMRNLAVRGIVRADFIEKVLNEHLPAYPGYYGEIVWILMMLEQWLLSHAPNFRIS